MPMTISASALSAAARAMTTLMTARWPMANRRTTKVEELTVRQKQVLADIRYLVAAGPRGANGDGLLRLLAEVGRAATARDRSGLRSALVDLAAAAAAWAGRDDVLPRPQPRDQLDSDRRWAA